MRHVLRLAHLHYGWVILAVTSLTVLMAAGVTAVPEVATVHEALTVVVNHDQIVDQGVHEHSAASRRRGERCGNRHAQPQRDGA